MIGKTMNSIAIQLSYYIFKKKIRKIVIFKILKEIKEGTLILLDYLQLKYIF